MNHRLFDQLLSVCASLLFVFLSCDVNARSMWVLKSGKAIVAQQYSPKSEAFCAANPGVLFAFSDRLAGADADGNVSVSESTSAPQVSVEFTLDAYCGLLGEPQETAQIQLNYGYTAGTATELEDYRPGAPVVLSLTSVPVFSEPVTQTAALAGLQIINDSELENIEDFGISFSSGVIVATAPSGSLNVIPVGSDGSALGRVLIIDDDDVSISDATDALLPLDPVARELADALDTICAAANQDPELLRQCQAVRTRLSAGDALGAQDVLRALAPEEVATQSSSVVEIRSGSQTDRVQGRLTSLRGSGAAKRAATSTTLSFRADGLPFGLAMELEDGDTDEGMVAGLLGSRWGGFISGDAGRGDRQTSIRENGFDFDRWGITGGLDYRISDAWFAGAALGFNRFDADLQGDGGRLEADIIALTLYSSYSFASGGYIEGSIGQANFDFDQDRRIVYAVTGFSEDRTASASFDAEQWVGTLTAGYPISRGDWLIAPSVGIEWSRTDTDSFTESGAGSLSLFVRGQDVYSSLTNATLQVSKTISFSGGVLVPYLNAVLYHEARNENRPTIARFTGDVTQTLISIGTDEADSDFQQFGLGMTWLTVQGIQFYADYRRTTGLDDFSLNAFSLGAKLEF